MLLESSLKFITSTLLLSSGVTVSLALFRVQLYNSVLKIISIGFILEFVYYFIDGSIFNNYGLLSMVIIEVLLIKFLFKIPFLYSIILSIFGFLGSSVVLIAVTLAGLLFGLTDKEVHENIWWLALQHILNSSLLLAIAFFIQSKKLGFVFMPSRFLVRIPNKDFNFSLFSVIMVGIILLQVTGILFRNDSLHIFLFIAFGLIFAIGIMVAYKLNKRQITDKYRK